MARLPKTKLAAYRARTFRLTPALRLRSADDAVRYVNERGFVYFWPISGVTLPSLWAAVAGDRPVADAHDDPGHITWGWKDSLLGAKKWYYAKLLRGKATMVSLKTLPDFYALSENYGDYGHDYLSLFTEGRLTQEARQVFEALLAKGPLDTVALRKEARLTSKDSNTRFERALTDLQSGLKILPIGVAQAGAWRYAFRYEIVDRHFPDLAERAGKLSRAQARQHLASLYFASVGAATVKDLHRLFRWTLEETRKTCEQLVSQRIVVRLDRVGDEAGEWLAVAELAS
jgi:hypothetical protein